jgi:hypothetical protein
VKFTIEFSTDNAAFADDMDGEVRRILTKITDQWSNGRSSGTILDTNGNRVGSWSSEV